MTLAVVALCLALGGGAYAAGVKLKPNAVKTKNIKNNAVTTPKIANGAVSAQKIAAGAVPSSPVVASAANAATAIAGPYSTVAQLGGVGGTGILNTSSFSTPNHTVVVTFSTNVFASGASNISCQINRSVNGGAFTSVPNAVSSVDVAAVAPATGADDASLTVTATLTGAKGTLDLRADCSSFNATGSATYNNLSAVAYPTP